MTSPQGINQRIADRLLADGQIDRDKHLRAVDYATRRKTRIEEALIALDIMSERDLLKFIATLQVRALAARPAAVRAAIAHHYRGDRAAFSTLLRLTSLPDLASAVLREGDFRLDPAALPGARSINASPEALLLEGMRRLDEAST